MSCDVLFNIILRGINLSELVYRNEIVTSALTPDFKENITSRRTMVYKTLIDPAVARMAAEKNKHKLFNKFLFRLNNPAEIEFVSLEKYYEPYVTVNGKYLIDYFRKCAYAVRVDKEVTEVILFNRTFMPGQGPHPTSSEHSFKLEGEERIIRNTQAFLLLNRNGEESKISEFPSAPSEENPQELIQTFKIPEIAPNMDVEAMRKKIAQRPSDINRIVNEVFEIDERIEIYRPIFRVTYKSPKIGKEAYLEFDGVTSKLIRQKENALTATIKNVISKLKMII